MGSGRLLLVLLSLEQVGDGVEPKTVEPTRIENVTMFHRLAVPGLSKLRLADAEKKWCQ